MIITALARITLYYAATPAPGKPGTCARFVPASGATARRQTQEATFGVDSESTGTASSGARGAHASAIAMSEAHLASPASVDLLSSTISERSTFSDDSRWRARSCGAACTSARSAATCARDAIRGFGTLEVKVALELLQRREALHEEGQVRCRKQLRLMHPSSRARGYFRARKSTMRWMRKTDAVDA